MTALTEKQELIDRYRKEIERLHKEISTDQINELSFMIHKAYYSKAHNTFFWVNHIAENKAIPFGLSITRSEIMNDYMLHPEKWEEISIEAFFNAMDRFISQKKEEIQSKLR